MRRVMIEDTTSFLLSQVCRGLHSCVHQRLDDLGLYRGQQAILFALWQQEGRSHSELAEELRVTPATISNAVKRMERAGFVQRRHDREDERISRVYLTEAGRDIQGAVEAAWREMEACAFAGFGAEEKQLLDAFFRRVLHNLTEQD